MACDITLYVVFDMIAPCLKVISDRLVFLLVRARPAPPLTLMTRKCWF